MISRVAVPLAVLLIVAAALLWWRHARLQPKRTDEAWQYKIGLPVIPATHDVSVKFHLVDASPARPAQQAWTCDYSANGQTAKFRLELDPSDRTEEHGIPMHFGRGRFIADPVSDARSMLRALAFALDGTVPVGEPRQTSLEFEYVRFGDNMSQIPGGGYQFTPPGPWTAMKLFLGSTESDAATLYFSVNASGGEAEFSESNSEYGDDVLKHLASVL